MAYTEHAWAILRPDGKGGERFFRNRMGEIILYDTGDIVNLSKDWRPVPVTITEVKRCKRK